MKKLLEQQVTKRPPNRRCNLKKEKFCAGMERVLQDESGKKGIVLLHSYSLLDVSFMGSMIVYKRTSADKGMLLNLCPWCGENLKPPTKKASKKK